MSDLVGNPEDRFSRVAAHLITWLSFFLMVTAKGMKGNSVLSPLSCDDSGKTERWNLENTSKLAFLYHLNFQ